MTKNRNTEQKIFEAATQLFLEKGVDRTSVRDIANKAGINLALMNYYFRSKENLFDAIFSDLVKKNTRKLVEILDSELPLKEKVSTYVATYVDVLSNNPLLVSFVMSTLHRSMEKIKGMKDVSNLYSTNRFTQQVEEEIARGTLRYTNAPHFFVDMLSLIAFPFAIKQLIMDRNQMDNAAFREFINQRKQHIPQMLLGPVS
ncbi:MAG: TetR/AcrR family transcriptional regulator [Bacteroidales bacterium]